MDRWNELIAGHVLGNLTAEEHEELAQVLDQHPQLNAKILQLRQTATLRGGLIESKMSDHTAAHTVPPTIQASNAEGYMKKGAEGWTDDISGDPKPVRLKIVPSNVPSTVPSTVNSSLTQAKKNTRHQRSQINVSSFPRPESLSNSRTWAITYVKSALKNPLWWLLILAAIGLGIDNVRIRRSLARIQDKTTYTHMENTPPTLWHPSDNQLRIQ